MRFFETSLAGAMRIELDRRGDARGFFARVFCAEEFAAHGLETRFVQINHARSLGRGTIRGLHFQRPPHGEVKLMRAVRGAIFDVIVDLRPDSPSFGRWEGFELSAEAGTMLYVPAGFAHGYQSLTEEAEVTYPVSAPYTPAAEGGVRWNDPALGIDWPLPAGAVSDKDAAWPDLDLAAGGPLARPVPAPGGDR
jgi:dTDP-4-dehydrorhamnose 3,5-epimerase